MKKWRAALYGFGMMAVLAACGSGGENIQIVEPEEIVDASEDAFQPEDEITAEPETEKEEGTESVREETEQAGETTESGPAEVPKGTPAVVNVETKEQEHKDGGKTVLITRYDHVSVMIEGNEAAAQAVMAEFEKREETFADNVVETLEWAKESPITDDNVFYDLEQGYIVTRNDGRVLAFSSMSSGYEGGAHGYYMEYGLNFDAETGQVLSIADITEDKAAFQEICVQEMLRQYEELEKQGMLFDREMLVPGLEEILEGKMEGNEWYFTEDGFRFISNIYEIAPYASGKITFDVPYEMVKETLKEKYR